MLSAMSSTAALPAFGSAQAGRNGPGRPVVDRIHAVEQVRDRGPGAGVPGCCQQLPRPAEGFVRLLGRAGGMPQGRGHAVPGKQFHQGVGAGQLRRIGHGAQPAAPGPDQCLRQLQVRRQQPARILGPAADFGQERAFQMDARYQPFLGQPREQRHLPQQRLQVRR